MTVCAAATVVAVSFDDEVIADTDQLTMLYNTASADDC
jgi:uncharacterized protein (DUF427 family)